MPWDLRTSQYFQETELTVLTILTMLTILTPTFTTYLQVGGGAKVKETEHKQVQGFSCGVRDEWKNSEE